MSQWDGLDDGTDPNDPPAVDTSDEAFADGDPRCAAGCGYPVELAGDVCGECACEDDGDPYG